MLTGEEPEDRALELSSVTETGFIMSKGSFYIFTSFIVCEDSFCIQYEVDFNVFFVSLYVINESVVLLMI